MAQEKTITEPNIPFGDALRQRRLAKGYSLRKFAGLLECSATYVSQIEQNKIVPPPVDKLDRISVILDWDRDQILTLANRVADDLKDVLKGQPKEAAQFLRTTKNWKKQDWEWLIKQADLRSEER